MSEYHSGAYFVRRGRGHGGGGGWRAAGVLILVLAVLTAAICLLIFLLPRFSTVASGKPGFGGKTFYFLAVGKYSARDDALLSVRDTVLRGGAGYVYNDGEYNIIAAVYDRESDAKALVSVNAGSFCVEFAVPRVDIDVAADNSALEYLVTEWFADLQSAADELQRGTITEAQAEHAATTACSELCARAQAVTLSALKSALVASCEYSCPQSVSVLSYIRYVHVRAIVLTAEALKP